MAARRTTAPTTSAERGARRSLRGPLTVAEGPVVHVAVGSDQVSADLVVADATALLGDADFVTAASDRGASLAVAAATPGLFGPRRLYCPDLEACSLEHLSQLADAVAGAGVSLVGRAVKLDAKAIRALSAAGDAVALYDCGTPTGAARVALLDRLAEQRGVSLDRDARRWLAETLGDDLPRARSVLTACGAAGITEPTVRHLAVLAGTSAGGSARGPFALGDAVAAGDVAGALGWLDESRADPFATLGYLRSRFGGTPAGVASIFAAEAALRSAADPAAVMDRLVIDLCAASPRRTRKR